jgi:hypothetical protein
MAFAANPVAAAPRNSTNATGSAQVRVIVGAKIVAGNDLRFGQFMQPTSQGVMTIDANGSVSATGGMTNAYTITQTGTGRGPATFTVNGAPNQTFTINTPNPNSVTLTSGANSMTITKFSDNVPQPRGTLDASGKYTVSIGAALKVNANQAVGTYTGTYSITVTYQ